MTRSNFKSVSLVFLSSLVLLTACQSDSATSSNPSTATTTTTTEMGTSSSQTKSATTATAATTSPESETSQTSSQTSQAITSVTEAVVSSQAAVPITVKAKMDVTALANGDFSSVAGTWQASDGDSFSIDGAGNFKDGELSLTVPTNSGALSNNYFSIGLSVGGPIQASGTVYFIPAGTPTPGLQLVYDKDVILYFVQSVEAERNPYYLVE